MLHKSNLPYRFLLTAAAITTTPAHGQILRPLIPDIKDVRQTCRQLLDVPMMNGKVTLARMEAATPLVTNSAMPGAGDTPARPDHCLVRGALNQRVGIDGKPYVLQFELRLPVDWNGRFWYQGGGGVDGVLFAADGGETMAKGRLSALARGFAVITTDSGHQEDMFAPGNRPFLFAVDPQARDEYGDQQIPMTHSAGMKVIARAYGAAPARSYFYGISNGGRQAMMAAQRYPHLFDGIVNYASGFRLVQAALAGGIFRAQMAAKIAPKKPDGAPDITQPLAPEKFQLVTDQILAACDGLDGAKDGMVYNSLSCPIDPMKWTCGTLGGKTCLTPAEARYLRDVIAGPKLRSGKPIYAPLAIDAHLDYAIRYPAYPLYPMFWGEASHVYTSPPTVGPDMMSYLLKSDLETEYAKSFATTDVYKRSGVEFTNADSPNLDAFMRHGGKLISFTGAADQAFSAVDAANYQEELFKRYGREETDAFTQLFIIPGLGHVLPNAYSVSSIDLIGAIVDWTENGKSPDGLMATAPEGAAWPGRTRPICAYPQIVMYKGGGSIEDGQNFTCH